MLVYGDRSRRVDPRKRLAEIARVLAEADAASGWAQRDLRTRALIDAGELAQGLADAAFAMSGMDAHTPIEVAALDLAVTIAAGASTDKYQHALAALAALELPELITCKTAEGYAFYAVYPELYAWAAAEPAWTSPPFVIGLRSIGSGIAAVVAAATGAKTPITVRPCGRPFQRELSLSEDLRARLAAHAGPFAIVDEGPGLSGSSFGCVADLLESLGVEPERIVFMPSHTGDLGPEASPAHRARWLKSKPRVRTFDDLRAQEPLQGWFEDLIGPVSRLEDLSGGSWRDDLAQKDRPPAWPSRERRKFRLTTASGTYLARFAGLGAQGEAKFARSKQLFQAGFVPEPIGLRRGMLLERWVGGVALDVFGVDRSRFLRHLARYLRFRAEHLPASGDDGAALSALQEMAVTNAAELGGPALASKVERDLAGLEAFWDSLRHVHVDARLHVWEWLRTADGAFVKTDALDHSQAHDLIGCQDIAWDIAGATIEFEMSQAEQEDMRRAVSPGSDPATTDMFKRLYAAFQAGCCVMAASEADAADRQLLERNLERYRRVLVAPSIWS